MKIAAICIGIFLLANIGMAIAYHGRALPNSYLGQMAVGGKSLSAIHTVSANSLLPAQVTVSDGSSRLQASPAHFGISVDVAKSLQSLKSMHDWVPILSFVSSRHASLSLQVNQIAFRWAANALATSLNRDPLDQHIGFNGSDFVVESAQDGHRINQAAFLTSLTTALQQGKTDVTVPETTVPVHVSSTDLTSPLKQLQQQLQVKLTFVYQGHSIQPSKADIGSWYVSSGQTMIISDRAFTAYINHAMHQYGVTVANPNDLAAAVSYSLTKGLSHSLEVTPETSSTLVRTYCTNVDGVSSSVLDDLIGKLAATYNDTRGWNDGGKIAFEHVSSGCQYTVWIAAPNQMTTFGAICDDYYNCQVGGNVILNYDRWTTATTPWNKTSGSLEDYRILMIDHESGHRLGFLDNPTCPGAGQPAPVMMQQSIDLKGCTFNVWPRPAEFTQLDQMLNIPVPAVAPQSE